MPSAKDKERPKPAALAPAFPRDTNLSQPSAERGPCFRVLGDPKDGGFALIIGHDRFGPALKFRKLYDRLQLRHQIYAIDT